MMKFENGAEIRIEDNKYVYDHDYLNVSSIYLEEFVDELQEYGIVDEFVVHANRPRQEVAAFATTPHGLIPDQESNTDLETCYEKVIEDISQLNYSSSEGRQEQLKVLGTLMLHKNAISNTED